VEKGQLQSVKKGGLCPAIPITGEKATWTGVPSRLCVE